jgi:hypothetical protein
MSFIKSLGFQKVVNELVCLLSLASSPERVISYMQKARLLK